MSVAVRSAAAGDVAAIAALEVIAFPLDPWSTTLVAQGVAGEMPTTRFRVAEYAGNVVGHVAISVVDDLVELQRIAVLPGERRYGIGSALLADAVALAVAAGAQRMLLEVREDNTAGRGFYDAHDFVEIARRERYYRDGVAALILEFGLEGWDGDE